MRRPWVLVLAALVLAFSTPAVTQTPAVSQSATGSITGLVADSAGQPIASAGITVTSVSTGVSRRANGRADGTYQIADLLPGVYRVAFSLPGFIPVERWGLVIASGTATTLNVTMAIGAIDSASPNERLTKGEIGVQLTTALGIIFLAIDTAHAPITSANFLKYVDGGFYDGGRFHRVTRPDNYTPAPPDRPAMEIIQAGINPAKRDGVFPPIALERTSVTGLKHVAGTVSMARGTGADTATSDFFICLDDQPSLDFGGKRFDDGQGGAAFGRVIAGMDVVRKIQQSNPLQPAPRQQYLLNPVPITTALRIAPR